eukprot:m51a1_g1792 hypothetical protein (75) ;mRNA; r:393727-394120
MKRRGAHSACFLCLKAKVDCDGESPCSRCRELQVPHMCLSAESINKRMHLAHSSSTSPPSESSPGGSSPRRNPS